jgi:hypothetical protein
LEDDRPAVVGFLCDYYDAHGIEYDIEERATQQENEELVHTLRDSDADDDNQDHHAMVDIDTLGLPAALQEQLMAQLQVASSSASDQMCDPAGNEESESESPPIN